MELTGTWRGEYHYELEDLEISVELITFNVRIHQSVFGSLRGVVEDDPPGLPGLCRLQGRIKGSQLFFRKIPDRFYTMSKDGLRLVAEYVEQAFGETVRGNPPVPHVHYHGEITAVGHRVEGVWHIPSYLLMLKGARRQLMFQETRGTWWMERMST